MNDRQAEELLALEAIYPDIVTWAHLPDERGVELRICAPVTFDEPIEAVIYNWSPPPPPVKIESLGAVLDDLVLNGAEGTTANTPAKGSKSQENGRQRRGDGRGRGGRTAAPGRNDRQLTATAKPFQSKLAEVSFSQVAAPQRSPEFELVPARNAPAAEKEEKPRVRIVPTRRDPPTSTRTAPSLQGQSPNGGDADPANQNAGERRLLSLRHLPAIRLTVQLPPDYPETSGPSLVRIEDEDRWLGVGRRRSAEMKLAALYSGDECLLTILDCVSPASHEFSSIFSIEKPLILRQAALSPTDLCPPLLLSDYLASFDRDATAEQFDTSSHLCPLCFTNQRGSSCIRLASCGCAFCVDCLKDYFSLLIAEGLVRSVACPSRNCVEKRAQWEKDEATNGNKDADRDERKTGRVTATEVERLVGKEGRERWEWLIEKARVESDPSITWCPREACQAPVPKLSEDDEKLRVCPACDYSFCVFCRRGWHGTRNACALPQSSAIVSKYLEGDLEERKTLEARYGAANIKRLVAAYEEERALQEWLQKHSTPCPGCSAWVEKSQGCNHMTCAKCTAHFCYRCGKSISPRDPYKHFSTPGMTCYGKLFEFAPGQGPEPDPDQWINFLAEDAY